MRYALLALVAILVIAAVLWQRSRTAGELIYTTADGRTTDDIRQVKENAKFKLVGGAEIPAEAQRLHEEGRRLGGEGKYDLAIASFAKASALAPTWAYPIYDTAFTLLLQDKPAEALSAYKRVDGLEPDGFFTTKTAVWSLEREADGTFPRGTYLRYLMLEDIADPGLRRTRTKALWDELPAFTPALKDYAIKTDADGERLALLERGLGMTSDPETHGLLMLNRATTLGGMGQKAEARRILMELKDNKGETLFTRTSAGELLKVIDR